MRRREFNPATAAVVFLVTLIAILFALFLMIDCADADDTLIITDLIPETDGLVFGTVGGKDIHLQKIGDITVGNIGDADVFLYEVETEGWDWTSGTIGDETIDIHEFDWEIDDGDE